MFRCVMSIHGIRTRGVWQKDLAPKLARNGFVPYALDYGEFSALKLLLGSARASKLEWLRTEYERVTAEAQVTRPSIIAHSFGTYLVADLLRKYPELVFDKIILAGSIVDCSFDWGSLIDTGQVNLVRNDYGSLDRWPRIAGWCIPRSGASGTRGFTTAHPALIQKQFPHHGHSDYFHRNHFEHYWIPTLKRVVVGRKDLRGFTDTLDVACQTITGRLGLVAGLVRANIFVLDENGDLRIPEGLTHNMSSATERTISMVPGRGCTGTAFQERTQTVAFMMTDWGDHTIPGTELAKVDKRLKWIISTPIPDPDVAGGVLGVFNVDCLDVMKSPAEISPLFGDLQWTAKRIAVEFHKLA
jgi:pimeloyl-ACP methyl ester carboxylesterase